LGSQRRHFGRIFLVGGGALLLGQESTFLRRHANLE
jgi:hypothetical protein